MINPKQQMADLAHTLCHRGPPMREQAFFTRLRFAIWVFSILTCKFGQKIRFDARGVMGSAGSSVSEASNMIAAAGTLASRRARTASSAKPLWFTQQKRSPQRQHQSLTYEKRGLCAYKGCPGTVASKRKYPQSYETNMRCKECSLLLDKDIFLCNGRKGLAEDEKRIWKVCK